MKITAKINLKRMLVLLAIPLAAINFTETAIAQRTSTQIRRCTPSTCTPYRANYEKAIANRTIARPSLVPNENQAISLADRAMAKGDRNEAARRLAQALVIISEEQGTDKAFALERALDSDMKQKRGQSLRAFLPLFGRIFPPNQDPYR